MSENEKSKKGEDSEKERPKNWRNLDGNQLKKLTPQQRSRYMAYEDPPKEITDAQSASRKRLVDIKKQKLRSIRGESAMHSDEIPALISKILPAYENNENLILVRWDNVGTPVADRTEREKHAKLIGQLKAAEARNRLRIMRLRFQANRGQEISHLISCQPTALNAVRLEALLPHQKRDYERNDHLDKLDRERCEQLVEDEKGLLTKRVA